jgi:predicted dehydrogenase
VVPHAFRGVMEQLQYALKSGQRPVLDVNDNVRTMAVVEAAYRSVREGRSVKLAEFGF